MHKCLGLSHLNLQLTSYILLTTHASPLTPNAFLLIHCLTFFPTFAAQKNIDFEYINSGNFTIGAFAGCFYCTLSEPISKKCRHQNDPDQYNDHFCYYFIVRHCRCVYRAAIRYPFYRNRKSKINGYFFGSGYENDYQISKTQVR